VFSGAINIETDDAELLTLASPSTGALPNGLVMDTPADLRQTVSRQASASVRGSAIETEGLVVRLAAAEPWSPYLEPRGQFRALSDLRGPLASALRRRRDPGGFVDLLWLLIEPDTALREGAARAYPAVARLTRALREVRLDDALAEARALVGLGQGLTPSGDDVLVGISAALRAAGHPLHDRFATGCAVLAQGRTTRVAEMFYSYAATGAFSARVHTLVASLTDASADLQAAFDLALDWGASSGADCLLGVVLGGEAARTQLSMVAA
jgi:hypothetical protein